MKEKHYFLSEHLEELRGRIIKSLVCILFLAAFFFNFSDQIIFFLAQPVGKLVFILPQEAFIVRIKVAFFSAFLISLPFLFYQVWCFISSGLKPNERRYVLIFAPISFLFFLIGIFFAYFLIIPVGVRFLLSFAADFLSPMITVSAYISFLTNLLLAFGVVFQLPLILVFLTKINVVTPRQLSAKRKQVLVIIFVVAAFLTPPDVVTQCFMAFPLVFLYEAGILFSRLAS